MKNIKPKLELNRSFFARDRHREKEYDNIFSVTYKSLSVLSNILFLVLFPPAITISNLLSRDLFLSIMNIFLSVGYCAKFIHKIQFQEVSTLELVVSLLFLSASIAFTFYFTAAISILTVFDVIHFINHIATGINAFFTIRNLLLPPFEGLVKYVLSSLGYEITTSFFNKAPFCLEMDRPVIDRLLRKFYKHDSFSDKFHVSQIIPFNNILSVLSHYINKYNAPFLGNLINQERITALENAVSQLIIHGNTDSSITFIRKKIDFKVSKIKRLQQSITEVSTTYTLQNSAHFNCKFFKCKHSVLEHQPHDIHEASLMLLNQEIDKQNQKLIVLTACLPLGNMID